MADSAKIDADFRDDPTPTEIGNSGRSSDDSNIDLLRLSVMDLGNRLNSVEAHLSKTMTDLISIVKKNLEATERLEELVLSRLEVKTASGKETAE